MKIPILSGITSNIVPQYRASYPRNLIPISIDTGIASGYLKTMRGVEEFADGTGIGIDRGGVIWNNTHYRVIGDQLCSVNSAGDITELGSVGDDGKVVTLDYSFDRLGIRSGVDLYYWDGSALEEVTDGDLGDVIDFIWIDGYFMTTDGVYLVVTELDDPTVVDPIKYGSSEIDPDPIIGLLRLTGEVYAMNRFTIEVFDLRGEDGFPFERVEGAMLNKGLIGTQAKCLALDTFFFVGGGRGEEISVYVASGGSEQRISTDEIDIELNSLTDTDQANIMMEHRKFDGMDVIYIHLPDKTLCYNATTSAAVGKPVWFFLSGGSGGFNKYRFRNWVLAYGDWICGDTNNERLCREIDSPDQIDALTEWEFGTIFAYNSGRGAIVKRIELVGLPGSAPLGSEPTIFHSYSSDGKVWSTERAVSAGNRGQYETRMVWFQQGLLRMMRIFKFRGVTNTPMAFSVIEADMEPLNG